MFIQYLRLNNIPALFPFIQIFLATMTSTLLLFFFFLFRVSLHGTDWSLSIYENGRVTIMFCSFETSPRILRFFCTGRVVEWDQPEFNTWIQKMGNHKVIGARAVILLDVFQV